MMSRRVLCVVILALLGQAVNAAAQAPGTRKWYYRLGEPSSPAMGSDGTLYVGTRTSVLHALNPNGTRKWARSYGCTGTISMPVVGPDDTIYTWCSWYTRQFHAINPDGNIKWSKNIQGWGPAIGADGTLYVGHYEGGGSVDVLHAFSPDGTTKWKFPAGGWSHPASIAADGTIYFSSDPGTLHAVYPDGEERWSISVGGRSIEAPAIGADGTVYAGSENGKLYAINPDGTVKWTFQAGGAFYSTPAIGEDGTIYAGCQDYSLYAVNPDGSGKWVFPTGDYIQTTPAIGEDGTIYLTSWDGYIYALTPDGQLRWKDFISLWWNNSSPVIGPDGTLYVGGNGGGSADHFYAFATDSGGLAASPWPMHRQNPNHTSRRRPLDLPPEELSPDDPVEAELPAGEVHRYIVETDRDRNLLIELTPGEGIDGLAFDAGFEQVAHPGAGDYTTIVPTEHGTYELLISPTAEGTYMITVLGTRVAVNGGNYTLTARYLEIHLSDLNPISGGNAGEVSIAVRGLGFLPGTQVELGGPGMTSLAADGVGLVSSTDLTARFDLVGAPLGLYDLIVTWPGGSQLSLSEAFTVIPGVGPKLEVHLEVPETVRFGRTYTARLEYANTGDADMPAPLLSVRSNALMSLDPASIDRRRVEVLAIGETETPEILRVGESWHVPIYFRATGGDPEFEVLEAEDGPIAIDWATQKDIMKPAGMAPAEWEVLWPALAARLGNSWADYIAVLRSDAARLGRRGQTTPDVHRLIAFETRRALGLPVTAIAGTLRHGETYQPLSNTIVRAISIDETVVREVVTADSPAGHFVFENLPSGVYELYAEGYYFEPTPVVDVIDDDVTGLLLDAYEHPPEPEAIELGIPRHDPSATRTDTGDLYMVWEEGNEIWWARGTSGVWDSSGPIPDALGQNPVVIYEPSLLDGGLNPGLLVAWESGDSPTIIEWVVGRPTVDGVDWSAPQMFTSDGFDDFGIAMIVDGTGGPLILWLQRDFLVEDDSDLYFDLVDVSGVEILSAAIVDDLGGAVQKSWSGCIGVPNFGFNKYLPGWVPVIGGTYLARFSGEVCGSGVCDPSLSGNAALKMKFSELVEGEGKFDAEAKWTTDRESCRYVFQSGKISGSLAVEIEVLAAAPIVVLGVPIGKAKFGVVGEGSVTGTLTWKSSFLSWPNGGEVTPTMASGLKGVLDIGKGVIGGEVKGTIGMSSIYKPPTSYHFKGYCVKLEGTVKAGWGIWKLKWKKTWGNACSKGLLVFEPYPGIVSTEKRFALFDSYLLDEVSVSEILEYEKSPLVGTGAAYEGMPVLGDISGDLLNDGAPAVAKSSTGEVIVVWPKDAEVGFLGGELFASSLDGGGWSTPLVITPEVDFVKEPAVAFDSGDSLMVVWSSASNQGLDYATSTVEEILAASEAADLAYAVRTGGVWSAPAIVTPLPGADESPALAAGPGGEIVAAWANRGMDGGKILAAIWDGLGWSDAVEISTAIAVDPPIVVYDDFGSVVLWAQDGDDDIDTFDDWMLMESRWDGVSWSAPAEPIPPPEAAKRGQAAPITWAAFAKSAFVGTPPPECCEEEPEEPEVPPTPPETPGEPRDKKTSDLIASRDPNEKVAPSGWGATHGVTAGSELAYEVHFENLATATAPAQEVFVTDCLDRNLDWTTFRLHDVIFSQSAVANHSSGSTFTERVTIPDFRPGEDKLWWVDVESEFDLSTGCFGVSLRQLDPETGDLPLDPFAGILPPEDGSGRGQGHLSYSVEARGNLEDGRLIRNRASIVFDVNEPIWTNEVFNTIGVAQHYRLDVSLVGGGSGAVTSDPAGINCGGACEALFLEGTVVELQAVPDSGSEFVAWGGDSDCGDGVVTMSTDVACDATFEISNQPPVANAGTDQILVADAQCQATATLDGSLSYDLDDDPLTYLWQGDFGDVSEAVAEFVLPRGAYEFTLTVTDDQEASHSDTVMVTVEDGTPPIIELSGDPEVTVECTQPYTEAGATAHDNCDDEVQVTIGGNEIDPAIPGDYVITFDAADAFGNLAATVTRSVSVVDTTTPAITAIGASPSTLWPPNHKMMGVTVSVSAADSCDSESPFCQITGVVSNEPETGCGSGNKKPDWLITGDLTVDLRAERCGIGEGRVYTVEVSCTDAVGNNSHATADVIVPHDQEEEPRRGGTRSGPG